MVAEDAQEAAASGGHEEDLQGARSDVVPAGWHVAKEEAVVLGPRSKPEPDVAVIRARSIRYEPRSFSRGLLPRRVEVADEKLGHGPGQELQGYARSGIPVYWIVNVKRQPGRALHRSRSSRRVRSRVDYRPGDCRLSRDRRPGRRPDCRDGPAAVTEHRRSGPGGNILS